MKLDKADVLELGVAYLKHLNVNGRNQPIHTQSSLENRQNAQALMQQQQQQLQQQQHPNQKLDGPLLNCARAGFADCQAIVERYLSGVQGNDVLKSRVRSHLANCLSRMGLGPTGMGGTPCAQMPFATPSPSPCPSPIPGHTHAQSLQQSLQLLQAQFHHFLHSANVDAFPGKCASLGQTRVWADKGNGQISFTALSPNDSNSSTSIAGVMWRPWE